MEDYHVDRRQVQGRRRPSRAVLIARACSFAVFLFFLFNLSHDIRRARRWPVPRRRYEGGNGGGVPPLPIPNREVKPACADGTAERRESRQPPSLAPAEWLFFLRYPQNAFKITGCAFFWPRPGLTQGCRNIQVRNPWGGGP